MSLVNAIVKKANKKLSEKVSKEDLLVDNIILGTSVYRKTNYSTVLSDLSFYLSIVGNGDLGFAYFNPDDKCLTPKAIRDHVNKDVFEVIKGKIHHPLKIALIDAAVGIYNRTEELKPDEILKAEGSYSYKTGLRANLLTNDLKEEEDVLLVGAVSEIAREVLEKKANLKITDLSDEIGDSYLHGIHIESTHDKTMEFLKNSDSAIITGATFSSDTIDEIIECCNKNDTKMIFYLETANNFGPHLIESGATKVVAEKFPFYDISGTTFMEVYKNDKICGD